jgi:SAM-dependent methyltransferase
VIAIDREPEAIRRLRALVGDAGRLETRVTRFEETNWPACDLVNASFALPFCAPSEFPALWRRIVESLRPRGRFCGQLFGERDEWAGGLVSHTRAEVERLLEPFVVERLDEVEENGPTALETMKHWHLFHVVARKR